jgi:DNA-binding response OmpR family regulator
METRATILLVEDHGPTRKFLADNLVADGYELLEAECASDARRLLGSKFPDLAIIDLGLPDRDGLELLVTVRGADRVARGIDPALPLLVLSGRASELDRLRGFERGCDDYVTKPSWSVSGTVSVVFRGAKASRSNASERSRMNNR